MIPPQSITWSGDGTLNCPPFTSERPCAQTNDDAREQRSSFIQATLCIPRKNSYANTSMKSIAPVLNHSKNQRFQTTNRRMNNSTGKFIGLAKARCFCPNWLAYHKKQGHAFISDLTPIGLTNSAHRLVYKFLIGQTSESWVLHRCGCSACLNPYHLYLGTHTENSRDGVLHRSAWKSRAIRKQPTAPELLEEIRNSGNPIYRPKPIAMSNECSLSTDVFMGFRPNQHYSSRWSAVDIPLARRIVWKLFRGPLQGDSRQVLSTCSCAQCINPYHLRLSST